MTNVKNALEMHASVDVLWDIMADQRTEQKYWTNIRDIKVLSEGRNVVEREATVGPKAFGQKTRQTVVLDPKRSIKVTITGDSIAGERTLVLVPMGKNNTRVDVEWNYELTNVPGFVQGLVRDQISKATEEALTKIAEDAERV